MSKIEIGKLIIDWNLYPRGEIDKMHLGYMGEAMKAGVKFPPIIIDKKSKRVTDGIHRTTIYKRIFEADKKVEVIEKAYKNEGEMLLDAMRLNSSHGKTLDIYDKTHCIILAKKFKIPSIEIAKALSMTLEKLKKLDVGRTGRAKIGSNKKSEQIPLKRTIRHMSGSTLTEKQCQVNEKLSGMNQAFYINQIIMLIESNLLNTQDENLMTKLMMLYGLIGSVPYIKEKLISA